jgi:hypothetical protein
MSNRKKGRQTMKRRILYAVQFALGAMVLWQAQALGACPAPQDTPCSSGCTFAGGQGQGHFECSGTGEGCCQYFATYFACTTSTGDTCSSNYVDLDFIGGPHANQSCRNGTCQ